MRDLHESSSRYVMKLGASIRRRLDAFAADTPMTPMEARVLQFVAVTDRAVCQKDLEQEYGCSAATISELVHGMEEKGLLCRQTDPNDGRRKRLTIPEAMRPEADEMVGRMIAMEDQMVRDIDPRDLATFMNVINRMMKNLPLTK